MPVTGARVPAMNEPTQRSTLSREELLALVAELQRPVAKLRPNHEGSRAEIDQLTRGGKRQAAPFSNQLRDANQLRKSRHR